VFYRHRVPLHLVSRSSSLLVVVVVVAVFVFVHFTCQSIFLRSLAPSSVASCARSPRIIDSNRPCWPFAMSSLPSSSSSSSPSPVLVSPTHEQYQAEIARLQAALAEARQTAQAAVQQAATHHQALAAATALSVSAASMSPTAVHALKSVKVNDPKPFSGHVGADAENWLMEVERWRSAIELRGALSDQVFLTSLVTFLQGSASLWWNSLEQQQKTPSSWDAFKRTFRERFRPINSERSAREALFRLRQRERDSVTAYSDAFLRHVNFLPDMDMKDQIALYQRGLLPAISDELDRVLAFVKDESIGHLSEVISQAQRIESRLSMRRSGYASNHRERERAAYVPSPAWAYSRASSSPQSAASSSSAAAADPNRMDLSSLQGPPATASSSSSPTFRTPLSEWRPAWASDNDVRELAAVQHRGVTPGAGHRSGSAAPRRVPGLSREEYDRLSREGRCFWCKNTGHMARNCDQSSARLN
jgi:hypothetical protein